MELNEQKIFREAAQVYKRVSRRTSILCAGTHATKPNESPKYSRRRIVSNFKQNVKQDVADAKVGIEEFRKKRQTKAKRRK